MNCNRCKQPQDKLFEVLTGKYTGSYCKACQVHVLYEIVESWNIDSANPNPKKCGGITCDQIKCRNATRRLMGLDN